jgi:hypothetical protein
MESDSNTKLIEEQQDLLSTIRKLKESVLDFESSGNYNKAQSQVGEIISSLNNFLSRYNNNTDTNNLNQFKVLLTTYENKKKDYDYLIYIQGKRKNIEHVRIENIYKTRRKSSNDLEERENAPIEEGGDYVYIPKDSINDIIKDAVELCDAMLGDFHTFDINRFKVIQDESFDIITQKSFVIDNNFVPENHKNGMRLFKKKLEGLFMQDKAHNEMTNKVKRLNEEIGFIKGEYCRKFKKYKVLKNLYQTAKEKSK